MTGCIPKESGTAKSNGPRPITLPDCKIKPLTAVLKLCVENLEHFVVPSEQRGFLKGKCMDEHLRAVGGARRRGPG